MRPSRKAVSRSAADAGIAGDLADLMRALRNLVDPYRPEQHYMRGPGPKWHAKHDMRADASEDTCSSRSKADLRRFRRPSCQVEPTGPCSHGNPPIVAA